MADVYAEYELRGLEPLALEHMPTWSVIKAAVDEVLRTMSKERMTQIGREIFDGARKVEEEIY